MLDVVDIYGSYQPNISISQLAQEGIAAVAMKATEGITWEDSKFATWLPQVIDNGMLPIAIHYLRSTSGAAQAQHFYNRIRGLHGTIDGIGVQLDCEADGGTNQIRDFVNEWQQLAQRPVTFGYSGLWWWPSHTNNLNGSALGMALWDSRYLWDTAANKSRIGTKEQLRDQVPASWWVPSYFGAPGQPTRAKMLQYTSRGCAGGLYANVDLNLFDGTLAELATMIGAHIPAPTPSPVPFPAWPGTNLTFTPPFGYTRGHGTRQQRMKDRGWSIGVDDVYGSASKTVCIAFQREKKLQVDGIVGPQTWNASWSAPITH
jgi:GH25 family lysozyme M1 (1,4-beta-N-acetylmuramidase)